MSSPSNSPRTTSPKTEELTQHDNHIVLVTGANGYVGSHVIWQLLENGYTVRGTLRNPDDPKNAFLKEFHPAAAEHLELVPGDLMKSDCWADAMKDVDVVMHVASPFQIDPKAKEDSFVGPAVTGTLNVVQAAADAKVRRLVLTSSIAAVTEGYPKREYSNLRVFTEEDWTDPDSSSVGGYEKSKALAELKAWEVAREGNLDMVVINPGLIFGPVFDKSQGAQSASSDMVMRFLLRKYPAVPPVSMGTVDVRDVATAHIKAMELPSEAVVSQRFLCAAKTCSFKDYCRSLSKHMRPYGFNVPTTELPAFAITPLSYFMPDLRQAKSANLCSRKSQLSNDKIKNVMDFDFRDVDSTLYEHALSLVKVGLVPQRKVPQEEIDGLKIY